MSFILGIVGTILAVIYGVKRNKKGLVLFGYGLVGYIGGYLVIELTSWIIGILFYIVIAFIIYWLLKRK